MNAVVLPRQVQEQLEAADRIQASIAEETASPPETPPIDTTQPPVEVATALPEPPPQPEPKPRDPAEEWKSRYDALQGKFNSEVPKLYEDARARDAQLIALQQQVAKLSTKPQEPPKAEPLVTSQDEEKFGSDLIDAMRRVSREQAVTFTERMSRLEGIVQSIVPQGKQLERVSQDVAETKADRYWSALDAGLPEWQSVNADPAWVAWLAEFDVVAGRTRQEVLNDASAAFDHRRVLGMFKLFMSTTQAAPPPAPPPTRVSGQSELARQVAPAKSSTTTTVPQGVKTFSGKEYTHWTDPRRVHDTPTAKLTALLDEMENALNEGRIKW